MTTAVENSTIKSNFEIYQRFKAETIFFKNIKIKLGKKMKKNLKLYMKKNAFDLMVENSGLICSIRV